MLAQLAMLAQWQASSRWYCELAGGGLRREDLDAVRHDSSQREREHACVLSERRSRRPAGAWPHHAAGRGRNDAGRRDLR